MRLAEVHPQKERFARLALEELHHAGGRRRGAFGLGKPVRGHIEACASAVGATCVPVRDHRERAVAGSAQHGRDGGLVRSKREIVEEAIGYDEPARQDRRHRARSCSALAHAVREYGRPAGERIDRGGRGSRIAGDAETIGAQRVERDEDDVAARTGRVDRDLVARQERSQEGDQGERPHSPVGAWHDRAAVGLTARRTPPCRSPRRTWRRRARAFPRRRLRRRTGSGPESRVSSGARSPRPPS
jgi:hypothetical protein